MKIKIHPLSNGSKYGWGTPRSLFDFFFPYSNQNIDGKIYQRIRCEATVSVRNKGSQTEVISREFYTFRAFLFHYWYTLLVNPIKDISLMIANTTQIQYQFLATLFFTTDIRLFYLAPIALAIAIDTSTGAADNSGTATSLTWSHTITGLDTYLTLTGATTPQTDKVSSMTYAGDSATRIDFDGNGGTQAVAAYMYYKIAPTTGSNSAVINVPSNSTNITGDSISYSGVKQTGQPDSSGKNNGTGTTLDLTTTVVATDCWLISCFWNLNVRTRPSGTTARGPQALTADSGGTVATGSNTHQWTGLIATASAGVISSISPAVAASSGVSGFRSLLGVGRA